MTPPRPELGDGVEGSILRLLEAAASVPPPAAAGLIDEVSHILGAREGRLFLADYSLRRLQQLDASGLVGDARSSTGSIAGKAFTSSRVIVTEGSPTVVCVPLLDGTHRIGLLELDYDEWDEGFLASFPPVVTVLVMALVTKNRYSDVADRARRVAPLSAAAEAQWDLLPPLSSSTEEVAVSGILEPAYELGGDSFDYAINGPVLEFAIVDAVGRGMPGVMMSGVAINSLRNSRRGAVELTEAYRRADRLIETHFGDASYVTGQFGALEVASGELTWINAGHVLPMLVRNGRAVGRLDCEPSRPFGLGGTVREVARERLHRGDRVLFFTDGIIESMSQDGERFGEERLTDLLARAALEELPVTETARRLSEYVLDHVADGLRDDATLLLIEYRGPGPQS